MTSIALTGVTNVRDLGGIPVAGGRHVKPGLLFRGGALNVPTQDDLTTFYENLGVRCVVDLRCGWELERKPDIIPDQVELLHIPYYDLEKVGIEYTTPAAGTKMDGKDLACDPDHYYRSLTNPLTVRQMNQGVHAVLDHAAAGVPTYFHCSGGKDRAGIMALLVLTVLGASEEAIQEDYLLTNIARQKNIQAMYERFSRFCETEEETWAMVNAHSARAENLQAFYQEVCKNYGSVPEFMENQIGVDADYTARMRELLTE